MASLLRESDCTPGQLGEIARITDKWGPVRATRGPNEGEIVLELVEHSSARFEETFDGNTQRIELPPPALTLNACGHVVHVANPIKPVAADTDGSTDRPVDAEQLVEIAEEPPSTKVHSRGANAEAVLGLLRERGEIAQRDIPYRSHVPQTCVGAAIKQLVRDGLIEPAGKVPRVGYRRASTVWRLAAEIAQEAPGVAA